MSVIPQFSLGTLDQPLKSYTEGRGVFRSAGPVSDAFILCRAKVSVLNGPVGSGKTTASIKRGLLAAVMMPPMRDGVRRYRLSIWRATYDQLWKTTIKSWVKILNHDKGIGKFTGSSPRSALHQIAFEDQWGRVEFEADFRAFGVDADPDDLGGYECTDAYLNEIDQNRPDLLTNLMGRIGRYPSREEINIGDDVIYGRIFGDMNAPSPDNWAYKAFFEGQNPSYKLFRQPGGLHKDAENIQALSRSYYREMIEANQHKPYWVRIKIHNIPGYNRENDIVYPEYQDDTMYAEQALDVMKSLPVVVGIDAGMTPAAAFTQNPPDGQFRILDEIVFERGDESMLAAAINQKMSSPRFQGCEFYFVIDPSAQAGEDLPLGSYRSRLSKAIGHKVHLAPIDNNALTRIDALRQPMLKVVTGGQPGLVLDPACLALRRGFNATYHYHLTKGTNDRSSVVKTPDSHIMEAAQYAALMNGTSAARQREKARKEAIRRKREAAAGETKRYNPLARKRR